MMPNSYDPRDNLGNLQKTNPAKPRSPAYRPPGSTRHHCLPQRSNHRDSGIKYLLYPTLIVSLLWLVAERFPLKEILHSGHKERNEQVAQAEPKLEPEVVDGGIKLKRDHHGYFRGTVLINDVTMPFLIDTGATHTTLPLDMAALAHLPAGRRIQSQTAGGDVIGQLTRAESIKIGNAELKNIDVVTNPHLKEVLIGMNTLRHFRMTQTADTLTMVASADPEQADEIERGLALPPAPTEATVEEALPPKPSTSWKKSTICDNSGQHCRTVYRN